MMESSDVVIIGGGVAGCAAAYYLALAGVKATIIEREGIGSQASGFSAGGLNPLEGTHIPGPLGPLAMESYRMHRELWPQLKADAGIDFQERILASIKVAFEEGEVPALQDSLDTFNRAASDGFSGHWLDSRQLAELEPRLSPEILSGVYLDGNGALDSYQFTCALAAAAEQRGARIIPALARGVRLGNGRVESVVLENGEIPCGQLLLAAGPWSREAEPWLDISMPVDPLKGEILRLDPDGPPAAADFTGGGASLYVKPDGLIWCGATEEWRGFDREPTEAARQSIWTAAARLMPALAQARLARHTACLRPVTPDWLPIIGQAPGWENVYLATGAGKKGVLLSPALGQAAADLMAHGQTGLSIEGLSPARFAPASRSDATDAADSPDNRAAN